MEVEGRDWVCTTIANCKRQVSRAAKHEKRKMRADRRTIAARGKAPTKKDKATRKADEERLAACRKDIENYGHEWTVAHAYRVEAYMKYGNARIARLERLLRDAGGEW